MRWYEHQMIQPRDVANESQFSRHRHFPGFSCLQFLAQTGIRKQRAGIGGDPSELDRILDCFKKVWTFESEENQFSREWDLFLDRIPCFMITCFRFLLLWPHILEVHCWFPGPIYSPIPGPILGFRPASCPSFLVITCGSLELNTPPNMLLTQTHIYTF